MKKKIIKYKFILVAILVSLVLISFEMSRSKTIIATEPSIENATYTEIDSDKNGKYDAIRVNYEVNSSNLFPYIHQVMAAIDVANEKSLFLNNPYVPGEDDVVIRYGKNKLTKNIRLWPCFSGSNNLFIRIRIFQNKETNARIGYYKTPISIDPNKFEKVENLENCPVKYTHVPDLEENFSPFSIIAN